MIGIAIYFLFIISAIIMPVVLVYVIRLGNKVDKVLQEWEEKLKKS